MSVGLLPLQHLFQLTDDPLFQPGDVALADAKGIGGFLLGVLHAVHKAEAQLHDLPLPGGQLLHGAPEGGALGGLLQLQAHKVFVAAQHVREQQLVAVAVGVQGLVDAGLLPA